MGKLDELEAKYSAKQRESQRELREVKAAVVDVRKEANAEKKEARGAGMKEGAIFATAAVVGTIVVDRVLFAFSGKWPALATYRKYLDFAIGIALVLIGRLKRSWIGLVIAGVVWLAIQIFLRLANMAGLATGFSVQGVGGVNGVAGVDGVAALDDVDLALVGAALEGIEDESQAYHLADIAETGIILPAAAVAIPALIEVAQKYGPGAVQAVQKMIEAARRGKKHPHGTRSKILDARAVRQAQNAVVQAAAKKGALVPAPAAPPLALPAGADQERMFSELSTYLQSALTEGRELMQKQLDDQLAAREKVLEARDQRLESRMAETAAQQTQAALETAGFFKDRPRGPRGKFAPTVTVNSPTDPAATDPAASAAPSSTTTPTTTTDSAAAFNAQAQAQTTI